MENLVSNLTLLYQGPTHIYLQGRNALLVAPSESASEMRYFIGNEQTNLVVRDFRQRTVMEAREAIRRQYQNGFAKSFNQVAFTEIRYDDVYGYIEVGLYDTDSFVENIPTFWMGVLEENTMPAYQVEWEVFKSIDSRHMAFCAMLKP